MRVIVIGSGIAGLTMAVALRKVGIDCTLYERAPELREAGAGISLWANALRALDHLGAGDAVRAVALPLVRSELRAKGGRRILASFAADDIEKRVGVHPVVAMVHRAELVGALAGLIPDGVAKYGFECVGVEQLDDLVSVRFTGIHLMRTGVIEANLVHLNEAALLSHVADLVARKLAGPEQSTLSDDDVEFHRSEYERLRGELEEAHRISRLTEVPSARPALDDLLVRLRLGV